MEEGDLDLLVTVMAGLDGRTTLTPWLGRCGRRRQGRCGRMKWPRTATDAMVWTEEEVWTEGVDGRGGRGPH